MSNLGICCAQTVLSYFMLDAPSWRKLTVSLQFRPEGGADFIKHENPDIICLQETKCNKGNAPAEVIEAIDREYPHRYWHSSTAKEGYSGVAMFSKQKPISVEYGLGAEEFDAEGRLITAEFDSFFLLTTYVPNAGRKLVTLDKRMKWDPLLRNHMKVLYFFPLQFFIICYFTCDSSGLGQKEAGGGVRRPQRGAPRD